MPLRDSFSERMEGTGSWDALEWTKIEPVSRSISYTNLEFLIEAEQVIVEVQTLTSPSKEEFSKLLESYKPNLVYLQGEQLGNDEVGPLVWGDVDLSTL
ncbi:hypothetical protein L484_022354 [Morus notabilis]|uniref:Uncharacterized protein n=1 Tax=Morus notabilis TaxID=981085 RepID=W9QJ74_9ROSA|nr:hypothetical protein L484_022354 [Morus notabilis]